MLEKLKELSIEYNIPFKDVFSMALNRYGVICKNESNNRIRFNLNIAKEKNPTYFAVCVNTFPSPFELIDHNLYLDNELIGKILEIEKDTCTSTYFRDNMRAITFNSNSRSKCAGCRFCGTYSLSGEDELDFSSSDKVTSYFEKLTIDNNLDGMSQIKNLTICTGCFENEDELLKHLIIVRDGIKKLDFNGSINYIGSQLRTYEKIDWLHNQIHDFGLYLTIEKFLGREEIMRPEKSSLTLDKAKELLKYCSSQGIDTTFLYILGLEDLKTFKEYLSYFKDSINKFPIVQVFQDYTSYQENYRCEEAKDIEYYLKARKILDATFQETNLKPKPWESFRGLYMDNSNPKKLIK